MPCQAFLYSAQITSTRRLMTRCSVGEKSRPSMRVWNLPTPPYSVSMMPNTSEGSHTIRPLPRSGRIATMLKLVGTASSRRKAL